MRTYLQYVQRQRSVILSIPHYMPAPEEIQQLLQEISEQKKIVRADATSAAAKSFREKMKTHYAFKYIASKTMSSPVHVDVGPKKGSRNVKKVRNVQRGPGSKSLRPLISQYDLKAIVICSRAKSWNKTMG